MLGVALSFSCLLVSVIANGELSILQNPESLVFLGQEQLSLSNVKNVLSATLGFSIPESPRWSGLVIKNPFNFADAVAVVSVPGVASLDSVQGRTYPLDTDEAIDGTRRSLFWRFSDRFPAAAVDNVTTIHVSLDKPNDAADAYGELMQRDSPSVENLKMSRPEDKAFIDQINMLDAITNKIADKGLSNDGIPDVHWITVPGLHTLIDTYGLHSKEVEEAKRVLSSSVLLLSEVFNTAYNDKVVFAVISSDAVHTRRYRRQADGKEAETDTVEATNNDGVDENYPVIFNIFLWFGISFTMVLLGVSMGIANMDPGRDSIIYRMTSNRMKKDN
ncbi:renin receptor [Cimex lectularius]|uniref:Renin receptor n=1 Tax=Cimex lectularius TaxID=79782 RepID=A0A8I6R637_CIMLE|nr:renin receptor [Cimex lectularius]